MSIKSTEKFIEYLTTHYTKKGVSLSSQKAYISILKNVRKTLKYKGSSIHFCKNVDKVQECIKDKSLSYKISTYSALSKLIKNKALKKQYTNLIKTLNDSKISVAKEGKYSDKERKAINGLTFEDLQNIIPLIKQEMEDLEDEKDSKEYYNAYQYYILSLLYLKCNFLPRLDYCSVKVIYSQEHIDNTINQLLIEDDNMTLIFRNYKNKKYLGEKRYELCEDIKEQVSEWLVFKQNIDGDCLFYNMNKKKCYDNKRFSELLKRMFLKYLNTPISCNHIRKLKEKAIQTSPEYIAMGEKEREEEHLKLFHSKKTAELHYRKS